MLDDAFQAGTEAVLNDLAMRPRPPKPQVPSFSVWKTMIAAPRGLAAGASEATASTADILGAFGDVMATTEQSGRGMFALQSEAERKQAREATEKLRREGVDFRQEGAVSFRNVARDYMPDPVTAHGAETAVGELFRMGGKAIGAALTLGPVAGAAVAGAEEGFTTSEKLAEQGVDLATRTKVGAVTAGITGVGFALPVAGSTWKATAGLALAGGPVSFTAQQAATRAILQSADYSKQAQQYDPFDPVGLALSTLVPLGFGAIAMRGARGAHGAPAERVEAATAPVESVPAAGKITDEATVDAARVSLMREVSDAHRMTPPEDLAGATYHQTAVSRAIDQMSEGQRVQIEDVLTEPAMVRASEEMAERLRPLAGELSDIEQARAAMPEAAIARPVERAEAANDARTAAKESSPFRALVDELSPMLEGKQPGQLVNDLQTAGKLSPLANNTIVGLVESGGNLERLAQLVGHAERLAKEAPGRPPGDVMADAVEAMRAGTPLPAETASPTAAAAMRIEQEAPELVVGKTEDGKSITARELLEAIRKEAAEGTDDTLGSKDAPLLEVAANCFLSSGGI